jgi:hypothetical protein
MRGKLQWVSLAGLAMWLTFGATPADAGFRPSFDVDHCSWSATHIVLVKTTAKDGVFLVMESWKGDLKPGESLAVPELKPDKDAVPIASYPKPPSFNVQDDEGINEQVPRQPIGSQMLLFLKRRADSQWDPASARGGMKVSALWIDGGKAFCFRQLENPGPSTLSQCGRWPVASSDAAIFTARIRDVLQTQADLNQTLAVPNSDARVERLGRIALSDVFDARMGANDALGKAGIVALPEVLQIMDQPPAFYDGDALIRMFVETAGKDSGKQLDARLQQDLIYWKAVVPTLTEGWLGQLITPGDPLFMKFNETELLVQELDRERYAPAAQTIAALRNFWVSQPQLYDPKWSDAYRAPTGAVLDGLHSQLFGLVKECDAFPKNVGIGKE